MNRLVSFALIFFIFDAARSVPVDGSNGAIGTVAASRPKKDIEISSEDVKSASNETSAKPKSASSGVYAQPSVMPSFYGYQAPNAIPYLPAAAPYYSGVAPATYAPSAVPSYPVASPYSFPWAAGPQQPVASPYSSYIYREQPQIKESKISPSDAKTFHRLLKPDSGYASPYYQAQPQFYSAPVPAYQPIAAAPAAQPIAYTTVSEYGSNSPYYNYVRSLNADKSYGMPSTMPVQYTPMGRDAAASTRDMYDSSFAPLGYEDSFKQIDDLRQLEAQNSRPAFPYEHMVSPRSVVTAPGRVSISEPLLDERLRWGWGSPAAEAISSAIPSPGGEDQVYLVMNPSEPSQNGQSRAADYYTPNHPSADAMIPLPTMSQMNAAIKSLPPANYFVNTLHSLPPYASPNIFAQTSTDWNKIYQQNLEAENKRIVDDGKKQISTQGLYRTIAKAMSPQPKSNDAKEMAKDPVPSKEEVKKSDEKPEMKKMPTAAA